MFVPTVGPPDSRIMLVGEAPGAEENASGKPFVGKAGRKLNSLLTQSGINRHECLIANVAREQPPGNDISFFFEDKKMTRPKPILIEWIELLRDEILQYRPNIVVALGATAMWALTGQKGIVSQRGHIQESTLVPGQKVIVTNHPQKVSYEHRKTFETIMDLRKAAKNSNTPDMPKDLRILNYTPSYREFMDYLDYIEHDHKDPVAVDVETCQPGSHIDIIGIATTPYYAMSYTFLRNRRPVVSFEKEMALWRRLGEVLRRTPTIFHNASYDCIVLHTNTGVYCENLVCDTLIGAHVIWPETPRSLTFLASICLNVPPWKHTSTENPGRYNAADAANTFGIYRTIDAEIDRVGQRHIFNHEMRQLWPAMMMQMQGLWIDPERLKKVRQATNQRIHQITCELENDLGMQVVTKKDPNKPDAVNLGSPQKLADLLYINMKLPVQYKRRKKKSEPRKVTTDAEAMKKLQRISNNPVLGKIMEIKKLNKLKTSFLDMKLSPTNRVHTSYNITGATMLRTKKGLIVDDEEQYKSFARWSSSKSIIYPWGSGNLQNIPYPARKTYAAPPGFEYVQADYMQAEAVVVAYLIGDTKLITLFRESFGLSREERVAGGYDVHKLTAATMFGIPISEVTDDLRKIGKTIRHATNYSAGPAVVATWIGVPLKEAKMLLSRFHSTTPQLQIWHSRIKQELQRSRTLVNLMGRKHKFLDRWDDTMFRSAYSYIPQSTVGDLMNQSLCIFYDRYGSKRDLILQLHDAMYVLSPLGHREETMAWMRECMLYELEANGHRFMIDVDFSAGPTWGEMEEL